MPKKKGFTLIELLVVIAILTIVASVGFILYSDLQTRIRDSKRRQDIDSLAKALTLYYQTNKAWPDTNGHSWIRSNSGVWPGNFAADMQNFISPVPVDPKDGTTNCSNDECGYYFFTDNPGTTCYMMSAPNCGAGIASVGANLEKCDPGDFLADGPMFDGRPGGCPSYYRVIEKL